MSSIYVSIPAMADPELIRSVRNCLHSSSRENEINIGIAFTTSVDNLDIKSLENTFSKFKNVNFKNFPFEENIGVGKQRRNAYHAYSGEDYLLQVDCHMHYAENWDKTLISSLKECEGQYGESILTAYPPAYFYSSENKKIMPNGWELTVSKMTEGKMSDYKFYEEDPLLWDFIPSWDDVKPAMFQEKFIKADKISAGFMFGGKKFSKNYLKFIPFNFIFFEEEIVMTLELINAGYSLMAPAQSMCIAHFYADYFPENYSREGLEIEILLNKKESMKKEYLNYLRKNKIKVQLFKENTGVDLFSIIEKSISLEQSL